MSHSRLTFVFFSVLTLLLVARIRTHGVDAYHQLEDTQRLDDERPVGLPNWKIGDQFRRGNYFSC